MFFLCAAVVALTANAEVTTLDLSTATDFDNFDPVVYDETDATKVYLGSLKDVWEGTVSDLSKYSMLLANDGYFMFKHAGDPVTKSWSGFTISKVASDTLSQFACAAKGGVAGEGTPFLVSYGEETEMYFNDYVYPVEVQICQSAYALHSMKNGDSYAKKFTDEDFFTLTIVGYDGDGEETKSVVYNLAAKSVFNEGWTKIDLTSIGQCMGFYFRLTSSDCSKYGGVTYLNTPAYFCIDALKVSDTEFSSAVTNVPMYNTEVHKEIVNGQMQIIRNGVRYTVQGQRIQ